MAETYAELSSFPLTPGLALYEIARRTGYAKTKADFARLLRLDEGNVYHHLAEPEKHYRLSIPSDMLHAWCWALDKMTGLHVEILLTPDSELELRVSGTDMLGNDIDPPIRARTTYATPFVGSKANERYTCDFQPPRPWRKEWEEEWDLTPDEGEGDPEGETSATDSENPELQE